MSSIVGNLMTFKIKEQSGDTVVDDEVLIEVTEAWNTGIVELAFNDRDERCYLKVNLGEVIQQALKLRGSE